MTSGSDCISGKEQFTKAGARERRDWWRNHGDRGMKVLRCEDCGLYHLVHIHRRRERPRRRAS